MNRPIPCPVALVVKPGSKILARVASSMAGPLLRTEKNQLRRSSPSTSSTVGCVPSGSTAAQQASSALSMRLASTRQISQAGISASSHLAAMESLSSAPRRSASTTFA